MVDLNAIFDLVNTVPQTISTFTGFMKEFLQDANLLILTTLIFLGYIGYIALFFFVGRITASIYKQYKRNIRIFSQLMFTNVADPTSKKGVIPKIKLPRVRPVGKVSKKRRPMPKR